MERECYAGSIILKNFTKKMQPIKPSNYLFVQQHDINVAPTGTKGLTHYFSLTILLENGITLS